jgi:hypothetical protein
VTCRALHSRLLFRPSLTLNEIIVGTLVRAFTRPAEPSAKSFGRYALFVSAYREAAETLRAGDRTARFPVGNLPPALPFVLG